MALPNELLSRTEQYLNRIATGGGTIPEEPYTRIEMYLNKIATGSGEVPEEALTRVEMYLDEIAKNGGGGSDITLETLNVSQNGTTNAPDGVAYNKVTANVPNSYAAGDAGKVVSNGALVSQTNETVTQNRVVDTTTIKQVTVNVPNTYTASDNGKVVSGGALVAQTAHAEVTQNGTIDTTTNNSVTVNVPKKETLSWHQCPEAVRNYLAAALAAYPTNGGATIVDQYAPNYINIPENVSRENSKPIGYTIDGVTFYNEVPNADTPFATSNQAGTIKPLDWLRWINTTLAAPATGSVYKRGYNCRDLGGWPCDGGTIRYGMLIRGSEPNAVDKELMVDQIGIKTEVQLLPLSEQATDYQMKSAWGIDWAGNDTENTKVYSPSDVSDPAKKALWAKILKAIIDSVNHSKPCYFHCGVGADRTGVTAMVLEGILGVSSDNVDIDFELTNFALGWQLINGSVYRGRAYSTFVDLKNGFWSIPLVGGLSNTFRNRCVSFALSLGITIDEINAFRAACIDGTPDVITIIVPTYTISKSGSHVAYDNDTASVNENSSYSVGVIPASGYVISGVSVTMGGTDITSQVFSGTPTARRVYVTNNLSHCSTSNSAAVVEEGAAYVATITANEGYTLDGATVSITMGGTNVSQYYSNGTISIQTVTGDVVINVAAVESARENLFDVSGAELNSRIASTGDLRTGANGRVVCNMIDITNLSLLEIDGVTQIADPNGFYARFGLYTSGTLAAASFVTEANFTSATYAIDVAALKTANPTATHIAIQICISSAAITAADLANLAIYGS